MLCLQPTECDQRRYVFCLLMHASVPEFVDILKSIRPILTKLTALMHCGTEMNAVDFEVKRSKFKVMVE